MDLRAFPAHRDGEPLEDYLRRALAGGVSVGALARHLDVLPKALYKIRDGGGVSAPTLARFGALTGVLDDASEATVTALLLLGLLTAARAGWAERRWIMELDQDRATELKREMDAWREAAERAYKHG